MTLEVQENHLIAGKREALEWIQAGGLHRGYFSDPLWSPPNGK